MPRKDSSLWTALKWKPEVEYFVVLVGWMGLKVQTENRLVSSVDLWVAFPSILLCEVCSTDEILSHRTVFSVFDLCTGAWRQSVTEETNKLTPPQFQILGRWEADLRLPVCGCDTHFIQQRSFNSFLPSSSLPFLFPLSPIKSFLKCHMTQFLRLSVRTPLFLCHGATFSWLLW